MEWNFLDPYTGSTLIKAEHVVLMNDKCYDGRSLQQYLERCGIDAEVTPLTEEQQVDFNMRYHLDASMAAHGTYSRNEGLGQLAPEYLQEFLTAKLRDSDGNEGVTAAVLIGAEGNVGPTIALIGDQSVGKSTVLCRTLARGVFPVGDNRCTLMPIRFVMVTGVPRLPSIKVIDVATGEVTECENVTQWACPEPGKHKVTLSEDQVPMTAIKDAIDERMNAFCREVDSDGAKKVNVKYEIVIELHGEDLPNLNVVDVPGTVAVNQDQIDATREVTARYLRKNRDTTLVFLVANSSNHFTTTQAYRIVKDASLEEKITVIYTKTDTLAPRNFTIPQHPVQQSGPIDLVAQMKDTFFLGAEDTRGRTRGQGQREDDFATMVQSEQEVLESILQEARIFRGKDQLKMDQLKRTFKEHFGVDAVRTGMRRRFNTLLETVYVPMILGRLIENSKNHFEKLLWMSGDVFVTFRKTDPVVAENSERVSLDEYLELRNNTMTALSEAYPGAPSLSDVPRGDTPQGVSDSAVTLIKEILGQSNLQRVVSAHLHKTLFMPIKSKTEQLCDKYLVSRNATSEGRQGKVYGMSGGSSVNDTAAYEDLHAFRTALLAIFGDIRSALEDASSGTTVASAVQEAARSAISKNGSSFCIQRFSELIGRVLEEIGERISENVDATLRATVSVFYEELEGSIDDVVSLRYESEDNITIAYKYDEERIGGENLAGRFYAAVMKNLSAVHAEYLLECVDRVVAANNNQPFLEDEPITARRIDHFSQLHLRYQLMMKILDGTKQLGTTVPFTTPQSSQLGLGSDPASASASALETETTLPSTAETDETQHAEDSSPLPSPSTIASPKKVKVEAEAVEAEAEVEEEEAEVEAEVEGDEEQGAPQEPKKKKKKKKKKKNANN